MTQIWHWHSHNDKNIEVERSLLSFTTENQFSVISLKFISIELVKFMYKASGLFVLII